MKNFIFPFILSFPLFALPRFAAENGTSCNLCHVNPTGAGLRNDYGISLFSIEELPMEKGMKFTEDDYTGMVLENLLCYITSGSTKEAGFLFVIVKTTDSSYSQIKENTLKSGQA